MPLTPFLARKGEEIVSEGHPFGVAQGRLLASRQRCFAPLHTPYFISLLEERPGLGDR